MFQCLLLQTLERIFFERVLLKKKEKNCQAKQPNSFFSMKESKKHQTKEQN